MGILFKSGVLFSVICCMAANLNAEDKDLTKDATYTVCVINGDTISEQNKIDASMEDPKLSTGRAFLLKGDAPAGQVCAVKTKNMASRGPKGSQCPYMDIELAKKSVINKIYIENNLKEPELSKGLIVWISKDGNIWKRVWTAPAFSSNDAAPKDFTIQFPKGEEGKFVKIGIEYWGFISLNKVRIYGN